MACYYHSEPVMELLNQVISYKNLGRHVNCVFMTQSVCMTLSLLVERTALQMTSTKSNAGVEMGHLLQTIDGSVHQYWYRNNWWPRALERTLGPPADLLVRFALQKCWPPLALRMPPHGPVSSLAHRFILVKARNFHVLYRLDGHF
jgi:hypothetical protein